MRDMARDTYVKDLTIFVMFIIALTEQLIDAHKIIHIYNFFSFLLEKTGVACFVSWCGFGGRSHTSCLGKQHLRAVSSTRRFFLTSSSLYCFCGDLLDKQVSQKKKNCKSFCVV